MSEGKLPRYGFKIIQGQLVVASGDSDDMDRVAAEAMHYAAQYAQDGLVKIATRGFEINLANPHRKATGK
jgi:hypothetical protein